VRFHQYMSAAAVSPDGNQGWMFAKDQGGLASVAGNLIVEPALETQEGFKVDGAEQIHLEGTGQPFASTHCFLGQTHELIPKQSTRCPLSHQTFSHE
jgi:hypothetical protein